MSKDQEYYCYILQSLYSNKTYMGSALDPIRRLNELHKKVRNIHLAKLGKWRRMSLDSIHPTNVFLLRVVGRNAKRKGVKPLFSVSG